MGGSTLTFVAAVRRFYKEQIAMLWITDRREVVLHADPHPGNLFVQPGPKLVLLDHGLTVHLQPTLVHALSEMVQALLVADFERLTKALAEAGLQLDKEVDITTLLQLVGVLLSGEQDISPIDTSWSHTSRPDPDGTGTWTPGRHL
jgi:predicted unusual protein kinase regulating ubiquinone biosynthesis (AarF/ABC1/UbiB family)